MSLKYAKRIEYKIPEYTSPATKGIDTHQVENPFIRSSHSSKTEKKKAMPVFHFQFHLPKKLVNIRHSKITDFVRAVPVLILRALLKK